MINILGYILQNLDSVHCIYMCVFVYIYVCVYFCTCTWICIFVIRHRYVDVAISFVLFLPLEDI